MDTFLFVCMTLYIFGCINRHTKICQVFFCHDRALQVYTVLYTVLHTVLYTVLYTVLTVLYLLYCILYCVLYCTLY